MRVTGEGGYKYFSKEMEMAFYVYPAGDKLLLNSKMLYSLDAVEAALVSHGLHSYRRDEKRKRFLFSDRLVRTTDKDGHEMEFTPSFQITPEVRDSLTAAGCLVTHSSGENRWRETWRG